MLLLSPLRLRALAGGVLLLISALTAQTTLTVEEQEQFLLKAKLGRQSGVNKGVTGTVKVTLTDPKTKFAHDASVQRIDSYQAIFNPAGGKAELNFKDSFKFNIAAYRLAQMIGIGDMVPPSVQRTLDGKAGSYTWWVDNVLMDDGERSKTNATAPNVPAYIQETALVAVFDQLIYNTDRNGGNLLFDKQWRVWMIDHSRAFRTYKTLRNPAALTAIDRTVLAKLKELNQAELTKAMKGGMLTKSEIEAVLARRDLIVSAFESKGPGALFDRPKR